MRRGSDPLPSGERGSDRGVDAQNTTVDMMFHLRTEGETQLSSSSTADAQIAAQALAAHIQTEPNGQPDILFSKHNKTMLGIYAGFQLEKNSLVGVIQNIVDAVARSSGRWQIAAAGICFEDQFRRVA
ncbi:hypothetical protein S40293_11551 [Stachybotrys chartarum IBT 40293]|nr:hypothetical protein S40293_11551 [Stachybotrys chartarum IBT 40293]